MEGRKIGQIQMGKLIGVTHSAIGSWINGNTFPTAKNVEKIANEFGVTKASLYLSDDEILQQTLLCPTARGLFEASLEYLFKEISELEAADQNGIKSEHHELLKKLVWRYYKNAVNTIEEVKTPIN